MQLDEVYEQYQHTWAEQDWSGWQQTLAADYRFSTSSAEVRDVEGTLRWSRAVFTAFPDYTQHVERLIRERDTIVAEVVCGGTFTGSLHVGGLAMVPSGRRFTLRYCKVVRFAGDGGVVSDRQYLDGLDLLQQLGGLPGDGFGRGDR